MKRKKLIALFAAEALIFAVGAIICRDISIDLLSFPLSELGKAIRTLSLSGRLGSIIAYILYFIIGLAPLLLYIPKFVRKQSAAKFYPEDMIPMISAGYMFLIMFMYINPGYIVTHFATQGLEIAKAALAGFFWFLIITFSVIKLFRIYLSDNAEKLCRHLSVWLAVIGSFIMFSLCFTSLANTISEFRESIKNNVTIPENKPTLGYIALILRFISNALISITNIVIIIKISEIIEPSKKNVGALTGQLAKFCAKAFSMCLVALLGVYAFEMLFAPYILNSTYRLTLPITELISIIIIMLFSLIISENKHLRDDNDLFI